VTLWGWGGSIEGNVPVYDIGLCDLHLVIAVKRVCVWTTWAF